MELTQKINDFVQLRDKLLDTSSTYFDDLFAFAEIKNKWFTKENIKLAIEGINLFLEEDKLRTWLSYYEKYALPTQNPQKIGLVMAGNIPLVGFHDFVCVLMSGHILYVKLSSLDELLMKEITKMLIEINAAWEQQIFFVDKINEADAYIATGSDNSARYFEYYFSKKPHIIRKNRNSVAVLNGKENKSDLENLGKDIFQYFGLGCRNVSKLYVPETYNFTPFFEAIQSWSTVYSHNKYANNYDYNRAIFSLNQEPYLDNGFLLINENEAIASPIGILHYEMYTSENELQTKLNTLENKIQVIVSKDGYFPKSLSFGQTQAPELWDYADGVDVMKFLLEL